MPETADEFFRRYCEMQNYPICMDGLGWFVRNCVRGRQIVCRNQECVGLKRCRRFPMELLPEKSR